MDRGNIPGFYYDEEKQKYFRIQPNHKVPTGTKYAKSNVKRERRDAKRRKKEAQLQDKIGTQMVQRSKILTTTPQLADTGLHRELGLKTVPQNRIAAERALASQASLSTIQILPWKYRSGLLRKANVVAVFPQPKLNRTILDLRAGDEVSLALVGWQPGHDQPRSTKIDLSARGTDVIQSAGLNNEELQGGRKTGWPRHDPDFLMSHPHGTSVSNTLCWTFFDDDWEMVRGLNIGCANTHFWDTAIASGGSIAIGGSDKLIHLNCIFKEHETLDIPTDARAVDWFSEGTMAAGVGRQVWLWDTRSSGHRVRFDAGQVVTGIRKANDSATQLVVTTNNYLRLYDVRMVSKQRDRFPVSIPILHEGPRCTFDIDERGLVAAASHGQIKAFSLATARELPLPLATSTVRPNTDVTQVSWHEDDRGAPYLIACADGRMLRWSWNGGIDQS